jgi:hypothetical protein
VLRKVAMSWCRLAVLAMAGRSSSECGLAIDDTIQDSLYTHGSRAQRGVLTVPETNWVGK